MLENLIFHATTIPYGERRRASVYNLNDFTRTRSPSLKRGVMLHSEVSRLWRQSARACLQQTLCTRSLNVPRCRKSLCPALHHDANHFWHAHALHQVSWLQRLCHSASKMHISFSRKSKNLPSIKILYSICPPNRCDLSTMIPYPGSSSAVVRAQVRAFTRSPATKALLILRPTGTLLSGQR